MSDGEQVSDMATPGAVGGDEVQCSYFVLMESSRANRRSRPKLHSSGPEGRCGWGNRSARGWRFLAIPYSSMQLAGVLQALTGGGGILESRGCFFIRAPG